MNATWWNMANDTDRDAATLDGISDSPLAAAELREIRRVLLERRRAGWLKRTGWKVITGLFFLASGLAAAWQWLAAHVSWK